VSEVTGDFRAPRFEVLRYRLWAWLCRRPSVCPATSHGRIIYGQREAGLRITPTCLYEDPTLGCWCGKQGGEP
jgi:hypothetical protein